MDNPMPPSPPSPPPSTDEPVEDNPDPVTTLRTKPGRKREEMVKIERDAVPGKRMRLRSDGKAVPPYKLPKRRTISRRNSSPAEDIATEKQEDVGNTPLPPPSPESEPAIDTTETEEKIVDDSLHAQMHEKYDFAPFKMISSEHEKDRFGFSTNDVFSSIVLDTSKAEELTFSEPIDVSPQLEFSAFHFVDTPQPNEFLTRYYEESTLVTSDLDRPSTSDMKIDEAPGFNEEDEDEDDADYEDCQQEYEDMEVENMEEEEEEPRRNDGPEANQALPMDLGSSFKVLMASTLNRLWPLLNLFTRRKDQETEAPSAPVAPLPLNQALRQREEKQTASDLATDGSDAEPPAELKIKRELNCEESASDCGNVETQGEDPDGEKVNSPQSHDGNNNDSARNC